MKSRSIYDDSRFINPDTLTQYAKTNEAYLRGPVKGLVIEFPGLDGGSCLGGNLTMGNYDSVYAQDFGANGILLAYLYTGPWSWSSSSVRYADAVIAAITAKYALLEETPLVVCGGSMGGYGALLYALEGRHNLCAVAIACPCTDIAFAFQHEMTVIGGNHILPLIYSSFKVPCIALWIRFCRKYGVKALHYNVEQLYRHLLNRDKFSAAAWIDQYLGEAISGNQQIYEA